MNKVFLRSINLSLGIYKDDFEEDGVYEIEQLLSPDEFKMFREFVIQKYVKGGYFPCEVGSNLIQSARFGNISHREVDEGFLVRGPIVGKSYDEKVEPKRYQSNYRNNVDKTILELKIINERLIDLLFQNDLVNPRDLEDAQYVSKEDLIAEKFDHNTF